MKKKYIIAAIILVFLPHTLLPQNLLEKIQTELIKLVEITKPSVVTILSKSSHSYTVPRDKGLLSFFKDNEEKKTIFYNNICSGLIYNEEGYIITKSDNINEQGDINVILSNGTQYRPVFVGSDQESGIIVLKIDAPNLQPCSIGSGKNITSGSWITIIGNSLGISQTISFGIINEVLPNGLIQISGLVNSGNNGSPIFDINGKVVGIIVAQVESKVLGKRGQQYFTEAGFAFPIEKTCKIVDEIIKSHIEHAGWIGIRLNPDTAALKIIDVIPGSPAAKAGLKKGDILINYNNNALTNAKMLGNLIKHTNPGSIVPISFMRNNVRLNVFVKVGKRNHFLAKRKKNHYPRIFQTYNPNYGYVDKVSQLQNKVMRLERELIHLKMRMKMKQK